MVDKSRKDSRFPKKAGKSAKKVVQDSLFPIPGGFLYFSDQGSKGLPLVFMYGLGCAITHWQHQMDYFQQNKRLSTRTLWADYRGHGRSSALTHGQPLTLDQMANDHLTWLQALCPNGAILLGQSLGGTVALKVAALAKKQHPSLVKGIVMVGTPGRGVARSLPFGKPSAAIWNLMGEWNAAKRPSFKALNRFFEVGHTPVRELVRLVGFNPWRASTNDVDRYVNELSKTDFNVFFDLSRELECFDVAAIEPKVDVPVLILAGKKDAVVPPSEIDYVAKALKHCEIEWFEEGSHCPHLDEPTAVNFRIELFLKAHSFL